MECYYKFDKIHLYAFDDKKVYCKLKALAEVRGNKLSVSLEYFSQARYIWLDVSDRVINVYTTTKSCYKTSTRTNLRFAELDNLLKLLLSVEPEEKTELEKSGKEQSEIFALGYRKIIKEQGAIKATKEDAEMIARDGNEPPKEIVKPDPMPSYCFGALLLTSDPHGYPGGNDRKI